MHLRLSILLLSSMMLISACGKVTERRTSRKREKISYDQVQAILQNQTIYCEEDENCPEGIARMFAINFDDATNSSLCTAFLVAPNLVMTNSHCVYTGLTDLEKTCSGLFFVFPTKDYGNLQTRCSKILWRDSRTNGRDFYRPGDNDFALIEISESLPIEPIPLMKEGLKEGDEVYPVVVDQQNIYSARILKLECKVEDKSHKFGVATLKDCPVISGNSGAAVMDADQRVVGLIFASSNENVRSPTDEIDLRRRSTSKGYAFSMDHIYKFLLKHLP